ncbi:MAG: 4-alpha-glucanotransferase, partial [Deltaproteobacteria bacterium]|nr:4-alpha-glucanotransferase [Deltaproteobacteria bacterium]
LLASIPVRDAKGQVLMMNEYLERRFDFKPTGFWLTERVWDPALPLTLAGTEMDYTVVDDTHFYYAGLKPGEIYGRYVTEKEGHTLSILATPMIMRYLIPFKPVEDVLGHLRELEEAGHNVALYGDDGEKFGLWPGTYEWVIEKGWLERFFSAGKILLCYIRKPGLA